MHLKNLIQILFLSLLLAACSESDTESVESIIRTETNFTEANTSQVLVTGDAIGVGTSSVTDLRKLITFSIANPDTRLSFSSAYAARTTTTFSDAIYWMAFVTNITSDQILCFVKLVDGVYKDNLGQVITTTTSSFVLGSVRRFISSGVETGTCLSPNEKGLFYGVQTFPSIYSNIGEVVFDRVDILSLGPTESLQTNVVHGGIYNVTPKSASIQSFTLPISNIGTAKATVGDFTLYVFVDSENTPLVWSFFKRPLDWDGNLSINEENILVDTYSYSGSANKMHVYIDYKTAMPIGSAASILTAKRSSFIGLNEYNSYLQESRNQQQDYLKTLVIP